MGQKVEKRSQSSGPENGCKLSKDKELRPCCHRLAIVGQRRASRILILTLLVVTSSVRQIFL